MCLCFLSPASIRPEPAHMRYGVTPLPSTGEPRSAAPGSALTAEEPSELAVTVEESSARGVVSKSESLNIEEESAAELEISSDMHISVSESESERTRPTHLGGRLGPFRFIPESCSESLRAGFHSGELGLDLPKGNRP